MQVVVSIKGLRLAPAYPAKCTGLVSVFGLAGNSHPSVIRVKESDFSDAFIKMNASVALNIQIVILKYV